MKALKLLSIVSAMALTLWLASMGYNTYKQTVVNDSIRMERIKTDLDKHAKWYSDLTPAQQDSVKRLVNSLKGL